MWVLVSAAGLAILLAASAQGAPEPVTTCGQVIQGRSAILTGDLDCSGFAGDAVVMPHGGRLALDGFTLAGATDMEPGGTDYALVRCPRSCRIGGPGTLSGGWNGAFGAGRLTLSGVTVTGAGIGANSVSLYVRSGSLLTGNAIGAAGVRVLVGSSTITANRDVGVAANRALLVDGAVVNGNGGVGCQVSYCADLFTTDAPRVATGASCGTSLQNASGETWGVCTND